MAVLQWSKVIGVQHESQSWVDVAESIRRYPQDSWKWYASCTPVLGVIEKTTWRCFAGPHLVGSTSEVHRGLRNEPPERSDLQPLHEPQWASYAIAQHVTTLTCWVRSMDVGHHERIIGTATRGPDWCICGKLCCSYVLLKSRWAHIPQKSNINSLDLPQSFVMG